MTRALLALLLLAGLCGAAPAATVYVSASAVNGIPAGNDTTGTGAIGAPWASMTKAFSTAVSGDTIMCNDGTYSAATTYAISAKSFTINGVTDYGCVLTASTGASAAQVLHFSFSGGSLILGRIVIDGLADTGFPTNNGITITDTAAAVTITLNQTRIRNYAQNAVQATGTATKVNFSANQAHIVGSSAAAGSRGGYFFNGVTEGSLVWNGGTITLPSKSTATYGLIYLLGRASGVTARITGVRADATLTAGLTGTSSHYGFRVWNVANALIEGNDLTLDGNSTTRQFFGIWTSANTASPAVNSDGAVIRHNTVRVYAAGGLGIANGQDGSFATADAQANGAHIYGNRVTGNTASESSVHGFLCGFVTTCTMSANHVEGFAIGYIFKGISTSALGYANTATKIAGQMFRSKGSANVTYANNTGVRPSVAYDDAHCLYADWDNVTTLVTTGAVFKNNICVDYVAGAGYLFVDAGSDATGSNNLYYTFGGGAPVAPWTYQGNTYSTPGDWIGAGRETVFFQVDPMLRDGPNADFRLKGTSPVRAAGTYVAAANQDFYGRPMPSVPPIGAVRAERFVGVGKRIASGVR